MAEPHWRVEHGDELVQAEFCRECATIEMHLIGDDATAFELFGMCSNESDAPEHCSSCGVLLDVPLTMDGERYVAEKIEDLILELGDPVDRGDPAVIREWVEHYLVECWEWHGRTILESIDQSILRDLLLAKVGAR